MERLSTLNTRLLELEPQAAKHESEIRAIFEELRTSPITLAHLQQTKIGLTVNKVRKSVSADANQAALRLIVAWKEVAAKQMAAAAAAATAPAAAAAAAASPAIAAQAASAGAKRKVDELSASAPASTAVAAAAAAASAGASSGANEAAKRARSTPPAGASSSSSRAVGAPSSSAAAASSPASSPPRHSPSPQPPMLSLASIAAAHSACSSSDPPPQPPGPQLYNPNLASYQRPRNANPAASAAAAPEDSTARKKTFQGHASSSDFLLVPHTPSHPAPPVSLCSLQDMCVDHGSFFLDRIPGAFLGEVPVSLALRILAKASPEQLLKFENANPRLLGETESLWRTLCKRQYPSSASSAANAKPASSTWKAWFSSLGSQKSNKLAAVQQRLKAMQEGASREKAENSTKVLSLLAATKIENKGRMMQNAGSNAQQGPYAKLKQETKALSKATWNTR